MKHETAFDCSRVWEVPSAKWTDRLHSERDGLRLDGDGLRLDGQVWTDGRWTTDDGRRTTDGLSVRGRE